MYAYLVTLASSGSRVTSASQSSNDPNLPHAVVHTIGIITFYALAFVRQRTQVSWSLVGRLKNFT